MGGEGRHPRTGRRVFDAADGAGHDPRKHGVPLRFSESCDMIPPPVPTWMPLPCAVRAISLVGLALSVLIMAACDDELVGPGWWDRLLAASGAPPSQEKWTAIRPYRFAHDTLTIRVGQIVPIGPPCKPRPGVICGGEPRPSDTAAVATWKKHVALARCLRTPKGPECWTDTQPTSVWLGDPPPLVPWAEAVDSGFVAVTDRATTGKPDGRRSALSGRH